MLTTELVTGSTWEELLTWDQHERDLAGECLFRFVFRSLYGMHEFNGDPHPGNYLFHGDGRVTFLDFGLVKHFTDDRDRHVRRRWCAPRRTTTTPPRSAGSSSAPACSARAPRPTDDEVGEYFSQFYEASASTSR